MATITLLTLNRGDHADFDTIMEAVSKADASALQEMASEKRTLDQLEAAGLGVWRGDLKCAEASPVVWDKSKIRVTDRASYPLIPGATRGGIYNMPKSLNVIRGVHKASGRPVVVGSAHQIQTNYEPRRRPAAERFMHELERAASRRRAATFVGGDWNARPDDDLMDPMRRGGWRTDQAPDRLLDTFGGRPIDHWWWQDREDGPAVVRFRRHWTEEAGSDHLALYATWKLATRPA